MPPPARRRGAATAIVLAGGRARRFGGDKLAAELDGETLLSRAIAAVASVAEHVVVVGANPAPTPDRLDAIRFMADRAPFGGPLAALTDALAVLAGPEWGPSDSAIVVGGDMPYMVPGVLAAMLERLATDASVDAVVLQAPDAPRRQVLPMAVRTQPAAEAATAALEAGDRSLTGFLARLATDELATDDWRALDPLGASLTDVDTQADLDRLRSAETRPRTRR